MKAYFCTKVIDWHETNTDDFKTIAAMNSTTDEYTPFSVPECVFFSDQLHLINFEKSILKEVKTCSVHKYIKENKQTLNITDKYTSDPIIKTLRPASFPTILPLVKGIFVPGATSTAAGRK